MKVSSVFLFLGHSTHFLVILKWSLDLFFFRLWSSLEIFSPAIVCMTPEVANKLSFTLWQFAREVNIMVYPIPNSVMREISKSGLQFFDKFKLDFEKTVHKK